MVAREAVAKRILKSRQKSPEEACAGAVTNFRLSEYRIFLGDGEMRVARQPRTRAHRPTVDRADNRFAEFPEAHEVAMLLAPGVDQLRRARSGGNAVRPNEIAPV